MQELTIDKKKKKKRQANHGPMQSSTNEHEI